jgi:diaminopimelate decarboxylase
VSVVIGEIALQSAIAEALRREAARMRTPVYVYDGAQLEADAAAIRSAFPDPDWTRLYSLKANGLPGLVRRIAAHGFGANAVSTGEITLAARAGVAPPATALEGIGKTPRDLRTAVELAAIGRPLLWVSLESADEAESLADLAARVLPSRQQLDVLVRVNPAVDPETHAGLAVGRSTSKFGVAVHEVPQVVRSGGGMKGPLRWRGLHVHVGSQLASVDAWARAVTATLDAFAGHDYPDFDTVDVGGGFPAEAGEIPSPSDFAAAARAAAAELPSGRRPARLAIEPGRAVVARAGWLVARVLHVRERPEASGEGAVRQVVLDAGMTELVRPALYGATHPMFALTSLGAQATGEEEVSEAVVDGPICESTDRFGTAILPTLERGDLVAIGLAGAYASAMFSSYNGRPRPPEVLVEADGRRAVLRRRGSLLALP